MNLYESEYSVIDKKTGQKLIGVVRKNIMQNTGEFKNCVHY